ncbi:MAG: hypothetical protein WAW39_24925 [Prosthecobacter sp.]|uniref:hypothetical protein n=1 Tax=Prosthecobacter sp. TaxID=1965333 RepID=UPI003BB077AF
MKSVFSLWLLLMASINAQVQVESLPEPGIQPQVVVTTAGVVHLVYLKGDPKACDIRHATRRVEGDEWTAPVTVNSEPRSAIAAGTIRGAQIALGKDGSVQVIWNGSSDTKPGKMPQSPLLHARLQPGAKAFSPQQNLMGDTTALDGGASIAANDKGHVCVVWHAAPANETGEGARLVWVRYSADDGGTFSAPTALNATKPGVCACCSLRAHLASDDTLSVLYRAATTPDARGMTLITSKAGRTALTKLDDWRIAACPMSSASLLPSAQSLRAAWENDGQIVTGLMGAAAAATQKIGPKNAKHPTLTQNARGQTLITSIIGSGWSKAGSLHWDILDAQGRVTDSGDGEKLPVWSYATAYARPDGGFVILR